MRRFAPLALLLWTTKAVAQVSGSLDLSALDIRYDLFQPSTALAVSPVIAYNQGWTSVTATGTVLEFDSGHRDLVGSVVGSTFMSTVGPFRFEVGGDLGASCYRTGSTFAHAFGSAHLHFLLKPRFGAWLAGTGGHTSFGGSRRGAGVFGLGLWGATPWATLTVTAAHSAIGDTAYTDMEGVARVSRGHVDLLGRLGARVGNTGGGHGAYGEASLTVAVNEFMHLTFAGGRYLTDPTRGTIAGRYAMVSVRLATPRPLPVAPYQEVLQRFSDARIEIVGGGLRVHVQGATKVEVMGDFTDWKPVELTRVKSWWVLAPPLSPGPHLVDLRIDSSPWTVPAGATPVKDEFGGEAGLILIPAQS